MSEMMTNGPRMPQRPRLRNDLRTLLRSRAVQLVVATGTVLQVAVLAAGRDSQETKTAGARETARPMPAAQAAPLARVSQLELAPAAEPAQPEQSRAEELADRYRRRGYRISPRLAGQIHDAAVENGIEPSLAFGLVRTESGFRSSATSHVGAMGLTQLMPATARWMEPGTSRSDLRDSETNLRIGFRYLRRLIRAYDGDTTLALLAYNRGPGTVDRLIRRGRDPDNGYADMVRGLRTTHR